MKTESKSQFETDFIECFNGFCYVTYISPQKKILHKSLKGFCYVIYVTPKKLYKLFSQIIFLSVIGDWTTFLFCNGFQKISYYDIMLNIDQKPIKMASFL